jgi:hypothetical protein
VPVLPPRCAPGYAFLRSAVLVLDPKSKLEGTRSCIRDHCMQAKFMAPRPLRSLPEIQNEARQLREIAGTTASSAERIAAAGLLSDSLDTSAMTQRLVTFRVKGDDSEVGEDADAAATVDDFLQLFTRQATNRAMKVRSDSEELIVCEPLLTFQTPNVWIVPDS